MSFCKISFCVLITLGIFLLVFEIERREFDPGGYRDRGQESIFRHFLITSPQYTYFKHNVVQKSAKDNSCMFHTCFDINRCNLHHKNIKVHIYPLSKFSTSSGVVDVSSEYLQILQAIYASEFYTSDASEACIFISSLDTLNSHNHSHRFLIESILESLEYWDGGKNHLIFNFLGNSEDLKVGSAMIASPNFNTYSYRSKFDISIPLHVPNHNQVDEKPVLSSHKNDLYEIKPEQKNVRLLLFASTVSPLILSELKSTPGLVSVHPCNHKPNKYCSQGINAQTQEELILSARYCFVSNQNLVLMNLQLMLFLEHGCLPVILLTQNILPFSEILDWSQLSVQIRHKDLANMDLVLNSTQHNYKNKLLQMNKVFNSYMKNPGQIAVTALRILDARVFPEKGLANPVWNMDTTHHSPLFLDRYPRPSGSGFTAVILTYNRVQSLFHILRKLEAVPSLTRILVIWNHQTIHPPATNQWPKINKPMKVLQTPENKLSNRFYPYSEIETECVFSLDDDINMLTADEIEFGFQVWREYPDRIVGFPSRVHTGNNTSLSWGYDSEWKNQHSLILTGAAFYNNYWSYVYTGSPHQSEHEIKNWVDQNMNCEDIAFNFMVSNSTNKPNIKIGPRKKFRCLTADCDNTGMLSQDLSHLARRSQCINKFARAYGRMPLKTVEFRADPVLYKNNLPPSVQVYSDIGSL